MRFFTCLLFLSLLSHLANAQIIRVATSPGAIPAQIPGYSEVDSINTKTVSYTPSTPPTPPTPIDDDSTTEVDKVYHYADILPVSISMSDGNITSTTAGKVWTLRISIPNALNIGFVFDEFDLSAAAEMYIFNEDRTALDSMIKMSHFTTSNPPGIVPFKGNSIIIYIVEPGNFSSFESEIAIEELEAGFQEIQDVGDTEEELLRASVNCNPQIQCQPARLPSARAVAIMYYRGATCTCTLLNNEANNGRAFTLTAFHCIDFMGGGPAGLLPNNQIDPEELAALTGARFDFRFWRTTCNGADYARRLTFIGAELHGSSKSSDVAFLELLDPPGVGDGVTYAGWSRQDYAPADDYSYIIHHPQGYDMRVTSTTSVGHWLWNNKFWTAKYSSGTVDHGSSGSALFNEYDQVVGQLKGGWSNCDWTDFGDRYGKFYYSWSGASLQQWLSPVSDHQAVNALILNPVTMTGPASIACNVNGYTYTVPNLLGCTYTWNVSANLSIQSGQGTASAVIVKNTNDPYSNGTVSVTINDSKGYSRTVTVIKNVAVGGAPTISTLSRTITTGGMTYGLQDCNVLETQISSGQYAGYISVSDQVATSYSWTLIDKAPGAAVHLLNNPNTQNVQVDIKPAGKWATYKLTTSNSCGNFYFYATFMSNTPCNLSRGVGPKTTITPNPAKTKITITIDDLPKSDLPPAGAIKEPVTINAMAGRQNNGSNETLNQPPASNDKVFIQQIKVFDVAGVLKKSIRYNSFTQQVTIPVSDLTTGIYFVEIYSNAGLQRKKIFVQQ